MGIYEKTTEDLKSRIGSRLTIVDTADDLSTYVAGEFCDLLEQKQKKDEILTVILPVGPLDYRFFAREINIRNLSLKNVRTITMDEYLDEDDNIIPLSHPMSFRRFVNDTFFSHIAREKRPLQDNIIFPDPHNPGTVTKLIDEIGGADIFWGGFGITGHIAFNDPPSMFGEPEDLESFLASRTRKITISPVSNAQMLMGGSFGNDEILPKRAITIGIYEIMKSKEIHLTFMRNWHRGLWRRALFGPVTPQFPGSVIQTHSNYRVIMTKFAANLDGYMVAQTIGEE